MLPLNKEQHNLSNFSEEDIQDMSCGNRILNKKPAELAGFFVYLHSRFSFYVLESRAASHLGSPLTDES